MKNKLEPHKVPGAFSRNGTWYLPVLISVLLLPSLLHAAEPQSCRQTMEAIRGDQLMRLSRIEEDFMKASWYYRKSQETVYTPLWEAGLKKLDAYSKTQQAEGEVAFGRYRHDADTDHEQAVQAVERIKSGLENF